MLAPSTGLADVRGRPLPWNAVRLRMLKSRHIFGVRVLQMMQLALQMRRWSVR